MATPHQSFDAATAALTPGVNLVEAGAGTGKTFAIAMLVLRFVTEFNFPLPQILVVTFTKAATEELRERIRARLASARELLIREEKTEDGSQESEENDPADPALAAWREGLIERSISGELVRQRLELALLDMDLAPVFTIHGFCQRMLQEQALESGQLFDFELTTDVTVQRNEVICDYWRRTVYPLSPLHGALITSAFATPAELAKSVEGAAKRVARIEPRVIPFDEALARFDQSLAALAGWWKASAHLLLPLLEEAIARGQFKKELSGHLGDWWSRLDAFLTGSTLQVPETLDFLSPARIREQLNGNKFRASGGQSGEEKKQAFLASLPLPGNELAELTQARADITLALRMGLAAELTDGLSRTLRRHNLLSFDDLIIRLAQSLTGPQGPELRRILGERFAAALIDEFQDTDDAQYAIFSSLFGSPHSRLHSSQDREDKRVMTKQYNGYAEESRSDVDEGVGLKATWNHFLYLIGDPKQAIYTFRGADIYSYFKARQQADIHLNLARNFRSHPALVAAVNHLFSLRDDAFTGRDLPYHPVQPARSAEDGRLLQEGQELPAMHYCYLDSNPGSQDGRWSATGATARIISFIAAECASLLQSAPPIVLQTGDQPPRPLVASDIAILVRSHSQGEKFQTALARAGIPAVMASQQSVLASVECDQLLLLLQALEAPGDAALVKAALTLPWFGMTGPELHTLWQDPAQVDCWLNRFFDYHQLWRERGFPAMMTRLLEEENILLHLARRPLAERRIANIHHLLELIQTAGTEEAMGPAKTLQWLQAAKKSAQNAPRGQEETELRLESDAEAVSIVTMHGAKGLEYPVVFCPFLWQRNNYLKSAKGCVICHDAHMDLVMDLGSPDFEKHREQALREELAEELRLAYVALTRARCRCYAFWAEVKGHSASRDSRHSALAWLLSLEEGAGFGERAPLLQATRATDVRLLPADAVDDGPAHITAGKTVAEELTPLRFSGPDPHTDWMLHSYSSLAAGQPEWADQMEPPEAARPFPPDSAALFPDLPDLPKGAALGNVVHALLETLPFAALAATDEDFEADIRRQCAWFGVEVNPVQIRSLLRKVVQTPLPAETAPFCLADLHQDKTVREMPFYLRLQPGSTGQVNDILAGSPAVTPVSPRVLQGYLTGFIDLVCCHQGKYYVMDYKSNYLGDRLEDYRPERLQQAMAGHNYGLQYWLYTLMLHRYLQSSVNGYDYTTHFGGIMYLFIRGMEPSRPGSGVYYDLPDGAILERLEQCLCRTPEAHMIDGGSANG